MLDLLRRASKGWVAKLLLILLVVSFGVWGISGSILGAGSNSVITVGETTVSPNEFRLAYDRQVAAVSQQLGTRLTTEQARAFGIEAQVYSQLVAGAVLDEQSRQMNLGLSDDRLAALVADDPAFHDFNGQFVRANFQSILRSVGMSEEDYLRDRSRVAVRTQIVEAVSEGFKAPDAMVAALAQYEAETRDIDYVFLTKDILDPIPAPSDATLAAFFEERKADYAAPEYRKISYVKLQSSDIADQQAISDDAVRADYEARKDRFGAPERRTVDQLVFTDRAMADAAAARLAGGSTFEDLATEQGRSAADIRLGEFSRATMPDQTLAAAAFAVTTQGGMSPVVEGLFGPVILRVATITPASVQSFEEIAPRLREELALVEANQRLLDVHDAYEDARAGGKTMQEAATQQKLAAVTVAAVDRTGRTPDGTVLTDLPESQALLRDAFETDIGVEARPLNIGSNGFVWFEVEEVIEARDRRLEEVRDRAVADWTTMKTREALGTRAAALAERLAKGEDIAAIAAEISAAVENKFSLSRSGADPIFGEAAIKAAFGGSNGHSGVALDSSADNRILFKVRSVSGAEGVSADTVPQEEKDMVARRTGDDILDQLVNRLQTDYGVTINQSVAETAMSF